MSATAVSGLVNAYEVQAVVMWFAGKTVWSIPEHLECELLQYRRCINPLTFTFTPLANDWCMTVTIRAWQTLRWLKDDDQRRLVDSTGLCMCLCSKKIWRHSVASFWLSLTALCIVYKTSQLRWSLCRVHTRPTSRTSFCLCLICCLSVTL